jgi:hypothetical protein
MKQYQETKEGNLTTDNMTIPPSHGLYRIAQEEVAAGEAVIIPFDHVAADAAQAAQEALSEATSYLTSTDWYVVRFAETGVNVPDDVAAKRAQSRVTVEQYRDNIAVL